MKIFSLVYLSVCFRKSKNYEMVLLKQIELFNLNILDNHDLFKVSIFLEMLNIIC